MRYIVSAVLAMILIATGTAHPHSRDRLLGDVSIEVLSDQGNTLLTVPHRDLRKGGTRIIKQYVEARKGERYSIIIRNRTAERIGVVVAVDGRNIISGKRSDLRSTEDMYLVNAYDQGRYDGWRTDQETVHRFYFTDPGDSYSMRTFSDASSMGVIAVAAYREKDRPRPPQEEIRKQESAPAAPSASSAERSKSLAAREEAAGTGFGESQFSPTFMVAFDPERTPFQKTLVKYEWREVLCRKGIVHCGTDTGNRLWDESEYAPPPPAYRGN